jgi:ribonuclease J
MRACIHRGAKEIGGTCVEIEAQGRRVVLDVGQPLDVEDPGQIPFHPVPGFARPDQSLLAVVISHPHQDHYGLAYRLPAETRFLIGRAAEHILRAATPFVPGGVHFARVQHLEDRMPITLPPFTITPYLMDHSAYDAYAIHAEADGRSLFYSGDLRAHGRKAALFHKLLRKPPKQVDVLLLEGTTLGRPDEPPVTEADLEAQLTAQFWATPGMPLVWCSGQNIDRIVTVFKACRAAKRQFILDMYTAEVLAATENPALPQASWDGIRIFLPQTQKRQIVRRRAFEMAKRYKPWRIFSGALAAAAPRSVMLFRPSMMDDLDAAKCLAGACLICSVWPGYLQAESGQRLLAWQQARGLGFACCHTSGHATAADLQKLRQVFPDAPVVPVHTDHPERFAELFGNVQPRADGEWWDVG